MSALRTFIDESVILGKLTPDFKIYFYSDFQGGTSPGTYVKDIVKDWPEFSLP